MFLGIYNYTVYLTYLNALSGFMGICFLINKDTGNNHLNYASVCILISGICDMFDGLVSNFKKTRSIEEKKYGIQIDSLADIISFGILPLLIGFKLLEKTFLNNKIFYFLFVFSSSLYILAVLIRLAYFNIKTETNSDCFKSKETSKIFIGLPVTLASVVFPFLILSRSIFIEITFVNSLFCPIYLFFIILFSFLFIFDKIKFKKPKSLFFLFVQLLIFSLLIFSLLILKRLI